MLVLALQLNSRSRPPAPGASTANAPLAAGSAAALVATPAPSAPASALPSATPSNTPLAGVAPTGAPGFSLRRTVVSIRFPFKSGAAYSYSDNFLVSRVGTPYWYNHVLATSGGKLRRAHDGVDIYIPIGTPVLSPFDGVVIDPSTRWKPWLAARYGIVAVIASSEPTSRGYVAILAHLSRINVRPGDRVQRGEVLGRTGRTGNAEATRPHLHFELRAPFRLSVKVGRVVRRVDAFDPYVSLVAADPARNRTPSAP